ncbi:hypothetical protein [Phytohabitans houttuyneae]|uniref:hypothetical protein n=1 Tax=Phytohabitans houttuyneae TaxID=1076126 RepID=UPI00156659AF|nr:hypothetical protein [Phytohabitans houttuyneae]
MGGQPIGETAAGAVPDIGQQVTLEHGLRGRLVYRVVDVVHQYTDTRARRVDLFQPAPVLVDLEEQR